LFDLLSSARAAKPAFVAANRFAAVELRSRIRKAHARRRAELAPGC